MWVTVCYADGIRYIHELTTGRTHHLQVSNNILLYLEGGTVGEGTGFLEYEVNQATPMIIKHNAIKIKSS